MGRTKQAVIHEFTFAGSREIADDGLETCFTCGEMFSPPGVCIHLFATHGKRILADTDGYGICASCVLAGPMTVAERAGAYALRLREKARRRKDEDQRETENIYAEDLELLVPVFKQLKDFSRLPLYLMAVKIAETSRELEKPRPRRAAKVA